MICLPGAGPASGGAGAAAGDLAAGCAAGSRAGLPIAAASGTALGSACAAVSGKRCCTGSAAAATPERPAAAKSGCAAAASNAVGEGARSRTSAAGCSAVLCTAAAFNAAAECGAERPAGASAGAAAAAGSGLTTATAAVSPSAAGAVACRRSAGSMPLAPVSSAATSSRGGCPCESLSAPPASRGLCLPAWPAAVAATAAPAAARLALQLPRPAAMPLTSVAAGALLPAVVAGGVPLLVTCPLPEGWVPPARWLADAAAPGAAPDSPAPTAATGAAAMVCAAGDAWPLVAAWPLASSSEEEKNRPLPLSSLPLRSWKKRPARSCALFSGWKDDKRLISRSVVQGFLAHDTANTSRKVADASTAVAAALAEEQMHSNGGVKAPATQGLEIEPCSPASISGASSWAAASPAQLLAAPLPASAPAPASLSGSPAA